MAGKIANANNLFYIDRPFSQQMSPRSAIKNQKIRQETMEKIMSAAFTLIARRGYESTSIAQIAREAGISKGLLYNYFNGKEDLLEKIIHHAMAQGDQFVAMAYDTDPAKTMENLFKMFFQELRDRPDYWRLLTELTWKIDKFKFVHDVAVEKMKGYIDLLHQLFEQMGEEDPAGEAKLVAALFDGIGIQAVILKEDYPLDELEKVMIRKFCKRTPAP
jgi:AcrR family transcriptional regulator